MTAKDDLDELIERIKTDGIPNGPSHKVCRCSLDQALWVLWAFKEHGRAQLNAREIVDVARQVQEVSMTPKSVAGALNRAGPKIHRHRSGSETEYEIMAAGKQHVVGLQAGNLNVIYTPGGARYSTKRELVDSLVIRQCTALDIVDPYCGAGTLDVLRKWPIGGRLRFITVLTTVGKTKKASELIRDIRDFCSEFKNAEFRNCNSGTLHDRYMITPDSLMLLGHSIKDLGSKETFVIVMAETQIPDVISLLRETFERKWKLSTPII